MTLFSTTASSNDVKSRQVVSLKLIAETKRIVVITRGGDITAIPLEVDEPVVCFFWYPVAFSADKT